MRGRPREGFEEKVRRLAEEVAAPWLRIVTVQGAVGAAMSQYRAFMYVEARGMGDVVLAWMKQRGMVEVVDGENIFYKETNDEVES
jgi:hypothetical protein